MPGDIDNASSLELFNIQTAMANRPKPTMTFTGHCHFSECRRTITRGLFCNADCRDDHEIDERRKGNPA